MALTEKPDVGTTVYVSVLFQDEDGDDTDPFTVKLSFNLGSGLVWTVWTYNDTGSIVRNSQGSYTAALPTDGATTSNPKLSYVWRGINEDGTGFAANDGVVNLNPTPPGS